MDPKIKIFLTFSIPSFLFIAASIPLILKKIPPNCAYGIRTRKTFSDKAIWYKANRFGGVCILSAGCVTLAGCATLFFFKERMSFDTANTFGFILFIVPVILAVTATLIYTRRL